MTSNDASAIACSISSGLSRCARNISTWRDVAKCEIQFYDHDYGVELGQVNEQRIRFASPREAARLIGEACREPTALEILYYAQVGGPHVRGEA